MNQQPELPDFVRDMEIVQSLNRTLGPIEDLTNLPEPQEPEEMTDGASS